MKSTSDVRNAIAVSRKDAPSQRSPCEINVNVMAAHTIKINSSTSVNRVACVLGA